MNLRRRTLCIYCGQRIPGALIEREPVTLRARGATSKPERRYAARFACVDHWRLVAVDPAFGDVPDQWKAA
jgi:hypothetical protein